ncbi:MAG: hypothetical protein ACOX89_08830 [Lutispora sp.]|jgi:hypothetical protein
MSEKLTNFSGAGLPCPQPEKKRVSFFNNLREPRDSDDPLFRDVIGRLANFVRNRPSAPGKVNVSAAAAGCTHAARPSASPPPAPLPKDPERVAFENMAADFEQRTRLKVNLEDDDALLRDPGVNRVLQDRAVALVQGMSGAPMQPPANEAERAADEYLALQAAKATAQENKAREAFEKQAADFEQRFGIRVI